MISNRKLLVGNSVFTGIENFWADHLNLISRN